MYMSCQEQYPGGEGEALNKQFKKNKQPECQAFLCYSYYISVPQNTLLFKRIERPK